MRACRYFPFVNDAETLPQCANEFIKQAQKEAFATQPVATQQRGATQGGGGDFAADVVDLCDDEDEPAALEPHPTFEVFWQVLARSACTSLPRWILVAHCTSDGCRLGSPQRAQQTG